MEESRESACGFPSPASEGRKIASQAFPEGFKGIKERKANTEGKCAIYSWNKVLLAVFSSPVMLVSLKGLHTRLLPPVGFNHCSALDLQLLSPTPPKHAFSFLTGWAKIKEIKIIHERKRVSAAAANACVSNPSQQLK